MRRIIQNFLENSLDRFGYALRPHWRMQSYPLGRHLESLFRTFRIDCVFDVGANTGEYGEFLRREVKFEGTIVSVEPTSKPWRNLQARAKADPDWIIRKVALGAKPGRLPINITDNSVFSSFLTPDSTAVTHFERVNAVRDVEMVDVETVEQLLASIRETRPVNNIYLKLDTQGYDLEVLKGCGSALSDIVALQTEMSVLPIYANMPDYRTAMDAISGLDFEISGLFPVSTDEHLRLVEFDCVMVKTTAGSSRPQDSA